MQRALLDDDSAACCPPTGHGEAPVAATNELRGSFVPIIDPLGRSVGEMYLAIPQASTPILGGVLVIHDIFGPRVGRHLEICDELAASGFYAACPDLFGDGEKRAAVKLLPRWPIKSCSNILGLLCCCKVGYMRRAVKTSWDDIAPVLTIVMRQIEEQHAGTTAADHGSVPRLTWGAVGFCWGATPVARLLTNDSSQPNVGCGMAFHPSLRGSKAVEIVRNVRRPMMLCPCKDDAKEVQPGGGLAEVLTSVFERGGARGLSGFTEGFEAVRPFPSMLHGFMTRGPLSDEGIATEYREGLQLMCRYFGAHARE